MRVLRGGNREIDDDGLIRRLVGYRIDAVSAVEGIVALKKFCDNELNGNIAGHQIVPGAAENVVVPPPPEERIIASPAAQRVSAILPPQNVGAVISGQ